MSRQKEPVIEVNGGMGEGGGQILRSSLTLSMVTGKPFTMKNIRHKRKTPGLLRQHLTAVKASAQICDAQVTGAQLKSTNLTFIPNKVRSGQYEFAIGTAGSTNLVAQTLLPALMLSDQESHVVIHGGTHNSLAPSTDFLRNSFLPQLLKMGYCAEITLEHHGFNPGGGGTITLKTIPSNQIQPLNLLRRGDEKKRTGCIINAGLKSMIAQRECKIIEKILNWPESEINVINLRNPISAANIITLMVEYENITETVTEMGSIRIKAETVATRACDQLLKNISSQAVVSEHLADQLLIPMVLAGGGQFLTCQPSLHTLTNIGVIKQFIPCDIDTTKETDNTWLVTIKRT